MSGKNYRLFAIFVLLQCGFAASVTADDVSGTVRDRGQSPPKDGLSGVEVYLVDQNGKSIPADKGIPTDADGNYVIHDVPMGRYALRARKVSYVPDPHSGPTVDVPRNVRPNDIFLMRAIDNEPYYAIVATRIVTELSEVPSEAQRQRYAQEWLGFRKINLPPSSTAILAHDLVKLNPRSKEAMPGVDVYLSADPGEILKLQNEFALALVGKVKLPTPDILGRIKVSPEIAGDVALCLSRSSDASAEQRRGFTKEFLIDWDSTPAAKRLVESIHELKLDDLLPSDSGRRATARK